MEICTICNREFKSKKSLANHRRHPCFEQLQFKENICPNPNNNVKCKQKFKFSKHGLCRSCSAQQNYNNPYVGITWEERFGEEIAKEKRKMASNRKNEWNERHPGYFSGENNPNFGNHNPNKGKTWDEIYGVEKSKEMRNKRSKLTKELFVSGKMVNFKYDFNIRGPRETILESWIKKYGKETAFIKWDEYRNKISKTLKHIFENIDRTGRNNGYIQSILKKSGITYEEYLNSIDEYSRYKKIVSKITSEQPIYLLENFNKRGLAGNSDAYHLDHIYSIKKGFEHNIDPEVIGHISNLRFIPWKQNILKKDKDTQESWDVFQYFIENGLI